jgi:hypothetical protein
METAVVFMTEKKEEKNRDNGKAADHGPDGCSFFFHTGEAELSEYQHVVYRNINQHADKVRYHDDPAFPHSKKETDKHLTEENRDSA